MHHPDYTSRTEPGSCVPAHGTRTLMMSFNGYGHRESRQEADRIKKCPKRGHDGRGASERCPIEFGTQFPGYHTLAISGPAMLQLPKRHGRRRGLQPLASGDVLQQQCLKGRLRPDRVKSVLLLSIDLHVLFGREHRRVGRRPERSLAPHMLRDDSAAHEARRRPPLRSPTDRRLGTCECPDEARDGLPPRGAR